LKDGVVPSLLYSDLSTVLLQPWTQHWLSTGKNTVKNVRWYYHMSNQRGLTVAIAAVCKAW